MVRRGVYPPVWLAFGVVAVCGLAEWYPGPRFASPLTRIAGDAIIIAGLLLIVVAGGQFRRAGTDLVPFREVSALVTNGVYRFTRNPMYLGMALVLLGCAVTVGSVTALIMPMVFAAIIELRFIRPEEAMLRELFPEEFLAYCARVRRWI